MNTLFETHLFKPNEEDLKTSSMELLLATWPHRSKLNNRMFMWICYPMVVHVFRDNATMYLNSTSNSVPLKPEVYHNLKIETMFSAVHVANQVEVDP